MTRRSALEFQSFVLRFAAFAIFLYAWARVVALPSFDANLYWSFFSIPVGASVVVSAISLMFPKFEAFRSASSTISSLSGATGAAAIVFGIVFFPSGGEDSKRIAEEFLASAVLSVLGSAVTVFSLFYRKRSD